MQKFLRGLLHYDNFFSLLFIFSFFGVFSFVELGEFGDLLGKAFDDVELTDILYSNYGKNDEYRSIENGNEKLDPNIVIVNIGNLPREGIAEQIRIISSCNPKAIGIDAIFDEPKDPTTDSLLALSVKDAGNVVLASGGIDFDYDSNFFFGLRQSFPLLSQQAEQGYVNLETNQEGDKFDDFYVCRSFLTKTRIRKSDTQIINNGKDTINKVSYQPEYPFAVKLVEKFDPNKIKLLNQRNNDFESINYIGNIDYFHSFAYFKIFDFYQILDKDFKKSDFEGKIVLMGFLGPNLDVSSAEDKFYTPLNENYVGKAHRDMYGVVVHANIVAMILRGNFLNEMPDWMGHVVGLLITFLVVATFRKIYNDFKLWYDGITKVLAIIMAAFVLFIIAIIFDLYDYKIKLPSIYFASILLAGDLLEVYYGFIKNVVEQIQKFFINLSNKKKKSYEN